MTATAVYARRFASLVKIEHSVFALPYAYSAAILAEAGIPPFATLVWITVAMVGARSLAMALNRLIDAEIDARNPRTARREIPAGLLNRGQVLGFAAVSLAVFLIAVWQLPSLTHVLWPIPVIGVRDLPVPQALHLDLPLLPGGCDGLAPLGGWIAVTNHLGPTRSCWAGRSRCGSPASTSSTPPWISTSTALRGSTRCRCDSASAGAPSPGSAIWSRWCCWSGSALPRARAALLPGRGGDRRAPHLRERDRQRGRPDSRATWRFSP